MASRILAGLVLAACASPLSADSFSARYDALVAHASKEQLYSLLYDMPKGGDLHNHAGGEDRGEWLYDALVNPATNGGETFYTRARGLNDATAETERYHTIRKLAYDRMPEESRRDFVPVAQLTAAEKAAWLSALRLDAPGDGRDKFFGVIWPRKNQVGTSLPVAAELLVDNMKAFGAEHMAYLETQFPADGYVDNDGNVIDTETAVAFVKHRLAQRDAVESGVTIRFQKTVLRFAPNAEKSLEFSYAFVSAHRDLWVGINFAGIEDNGHGYPLRFLETMRRMRAVYPTLPLSIHAGETDGPNNNIRDALLLGASRIGHGVNLIKDPQTLLLLQQTRHVLVEVNLISNQLLEYTPDVDQHPFPEYLRTGVPVCLNTDDRGMWDSNLTDEYYTAVTHFHLSWEEILTLGHNSLSYAFAQPEVKARLLADFDARIAAFEGKYSTGSVDDALTKARQTAKPVTYGYARRTWGLAFPDSP